MPRTNGMIDEPVRVGPGIEDEVLNRYARGAAAVEQDLCCPASTYDPDDTAHLPAEVVNTDYGCGNHAVHAREGETVLDLGSGSGKVCYILARKVGAAGGVIGVDFNDAMLDLARKHQPQIEKNLGYSNVRFCKAKIQDLTLDLDRVQSWLNDNPIHGIDGLSALETYCDRLRTESPLILDDSIDLVVSNCVLNLVQPKDKVRLFAELHRVVKPGGRAVISDIVCDEDPTPKILADPKLWSGCISGAFREDRFLEMFEEAGFYGVEILSRGEDPWRVIDGVEFRSVTVRAYKGKEGPCLERRQAVIYTGPWKQVRDDDGHTLYRGQRMAVCDKTYKIMTDPNGPYAGHVLPVAPYEETPLDQATPFNCTGTQTRDPRETKGYDYHLTDTSSGDTPCCDDTGCC